MRDLDSYFLYILFEDRE